ncbi:helix-turn-helix domain-containing protein [Winogradskyella immobilis]|uniref:AraC family transcriptional regulator n=1 Tax=Winogradskyella immobilis TaxID=2816852 RepID=A0ABS8EJ34_9FLAO|nr:helix-turn-helix domain-containing protein [Winogradskyella immobilis]MCC1483219.1 AraC family transcriptional regulator [Winogradskyella immobilis]MCG0015313.1 helix-turn-helix domain-containing protein [Winogradskyella immobilis]
MGITFFNYILIAGVIQGFVFNVVTLFNKKSLVKVIIYLNLTVLFLSLNNLQAWLIDVGFSSNLFFIKNLLIPWYMMMFPMFYLFLVNYLRVKKQIKNILKGSILFFLLQILIRISLILYVLYTKEGRSTLIIENYTSIEEICNAAFGLFIIFKSSYLVFKQRELYNHIQTYDDIKWIKFFLILGGVIFLFWIFAIIMNSMGDKWAYYLLRLGTSFLLYWIGYQGFYRYNILRNRILLRRSITNNTRQANGSRKDISSQLLEKYQDDFNTINNYILKNNRFLDPHFSLDKLCEELNMSSSHISKIINNYNDFNFSDYINALRIEQAKKLLSDDSFNKYTIVTIGLECGFNSKSTFYTAFKKFTFLTPSQFRSKN